METPVRGDDDPGRGARPGKPDPEATTAAHLARLRQAGRRGRCIGLSATSGSSTASSASKSPLREAARKASTTSRCRASPAAVTEGVP